MYSHGLPATRFSAVATDSLSGPGFASGGTPGQSGICVSPGDGCHVAACAHTAQNATAAQNTGGERFMRDVLLTVRRGIIRALAGRVQQRTGCDARAGLERPGPAVGP